MSFSVTTIEHAVASVAHDIVIGAKYVAKAAAAVGAAVVKDAPAIEAFTALIDPRAAQIERLGAALIGELEPQIAATASQVAADASTVTLSLPKELVDDLVALYKLIGPEIAAAKSTVAAPA